MQGCVPNLVYAAAHQDESAVGRGFRGVTSTRGVKLFQPSARTRPSCRFFSLQVCRNACTLCYTLLPHGGRPDRSGTICCHPHTSLTPHTNPSPHRCWPRCTGSEPLPVPKPLLRGGRRCVGEAGHPPSQPGGGGGQVRSEGGGSVGCVTHPFTGTALQFGCVVSSCRAHRG